jgi:hypothetical protein
LHHAFADNEKLFDKVSRKISNGFSNSSSAKSRDSIGNNQDNGSISNSSGNSNLTDSCDKSNSNSSSSKRISTSSSNTSLIQINLGNISGVIPNVRWEFKQRIIEDGGTLTSSFTGMALVIELNTKALPLNVKRSSSSNKSATSTSSVSSNSSKEEHKQVMLRVN